MRADIRECCACGYQFPATPACPQCGSANHALFMRAPSRDEIRRYAMSRGYVVDVESTLTGIDPDWRSRFHGDADLALDFYTRPS